MHTVDYAHRGLFLLETMSAEDAARGRRVGAQKFLVHPPLKFGRDREQKV